MSNEPPRFPTLRSHLPIMPPLAMMDTTVLKVPDSPLHSHHSLYIILQGSEFCQRSIVFLQRMQDLTNRGVTQPSQRIHKGLQILGDPYPGTPYETHHRAPPLLRIIYLASKIYHRALLKPPVRLSSRENKSAAEELCRCLENSAHDSTWDHYPGIFLWCLLTGAAATQNGMPEHGFFVSLTIKVGLGAGYGWWEEMSAAMITFGKVKMRADRELSY